MFVRRVVPVIACFLLAVAPIGLDAQDQPAAVASYAEPSISPDGSEIAFVSGGDIWSVPASGGTARLLAAADGYASRPLFSPDGSQLAFASSRPGSPGIYVVGLSGGTLRRLTHDDTTPTLTGWAADSHSVYFSSAVHNIAYFQDVMRVDADGGTPMRVVSERYVNSADGMPSPDGHAIAFSRDGFVQWWRKGHSHMDEAAIVVYRADAKRYETIAPEDAKNRWPMWSPDGRTIYYVSDRSGHDEIWAASDGKSRKVTSIGGDPVLWPTLARDGRTIAFEHDFGIWTCDLATGAVHQVAIALRGLPDVIPAQHVTLTSRFRDLDLAPDGKKIAMVARGRVFAASASAGGDAQAIPEIAGAAQAVPVWAPDSRRVVFTIDRGTETALALYEFPDGEVRTITPPGHFDDYPHWSPDGKSIAFVRDGRELRLLDVATHAERVLATATLDRRPFGDLRDIAFSPAGDWIAFVSDLHAHGFSGVSVVPVAGGQPRVISDLPDANAGSVTWAKDGTRIFFVTSQRTEPGQIAQIDLVPRAPHFREDAFRSLFERTSPGEPHQPNEVPATPVPAPVTSAQPVASPRPRAASAAQAKHTTIDFNGIDQRISLLATGLDVAAVQVTPDGNTLVLVADAANQENLYSFNIDETSDDPPVAHQLTNSLGQKTDLTISPDGRNAFYLDSGRVAFVPVAGGSPHSVAVSAALDVDFNAEKTLLLRQAWSLLDRWYADPAFHGANWPAVLHTYEPHIAGARTPNELRRLLSLLVGELNSSHTGIGAPPSGVGPKTGYLGVQFDTAAYERTGRLTIAEITPLGPVALAGGVAVGDVVLAINGRAVDRHTDIDDALANTIGMRTVVRIGRHGDPAQAHDVVLQPVDLNTDGVLRYNAWVDGRRAYVDRISGGRLGYVHMFDMSQASLDKLHYDLDVRNRDKDGVVVDVRNNEGGFVDPYAIDVLARHEYLSFKSRFGTDPPERSSLGQRALDRPTVLVTNEHSLSDSENFTEGYRVLRVGKVVGTPTAGWIIFTSAAPLADGSAVRLPFTSVIAHDGVNMELHPRPVDDFVAIPPGAADRGDDPQLDAAVSVLLRQVRR
jgi:Tol biopolymer transport system component/C-terminal processing protease CtpA/Prc